MNPELPDVARKLLEVGSDEITSSVVADRAAQVCEQLVRHLARLLGEQGSMLLLKRSMHLASASFPGLATASMNQAGDDATAALRTCLESESPEVATEAFVLVLSTLVGLLTRLIGEGLVAHVLRELWPASFPSAAKDQQ